MGPSGASPNDFEVPCDVQLSRMGIHVGCFVGTRAAYARGPLLRDVPCALVVYLRQGHGREGRLGGNGSLKIRELFLMRV